MWKDICSSLGFCSLAARRFLVFRNVVFIEFIGPSPKILVLSLGRLFNIPISFALGFSYAFFLMILIPKCPAVHVSFIAVYVVLELLPKGNIYIPDGNY